MTYHLVRLGKPVEVFGKVENGIEVIRANRSIEAGKELMIGDSANDIETLKIEDRQQAFMPAFVPGESKDVDQSAIFYISFFDYLSTTERLPVEPV